MQEPQSLYHTVSGLPRLDVTLLIAITRLKARGETASSGCNDAAFTVLRVLTDFDALSNGVYDIQHVQH